VATNPIPVAANDTGHTEPDTPLTLNVLGNDHDGGRDSDTLTVVSATSTSGAVTINEDGTITLTPATGFVGLVRITYTISDGQGGFATAYATVLITPNIHVTGTTDVPDPNSTPLVPSIIGITAEGIVVSTVENFGGFNTSSRPLSEHGIVDTVANQISGLGGSGDRSNSSRNVIEDTNRVWSLARDLELYSGREQGTWDIEGLTGFSLRFTFAEDRITHDTAQVVFESMVRERTLIVRMSSRELLAHAHVVEYRVMQADGRALPAWLDRAGPQLLIGERPADAEEIQLRVIAVLSDGTAIEHSIKIQTMSGEIQPLTSGKRADLAPMFSRQIQAELPDRQPAIDGLSWALEAAE
jgi:Cadherin-like domain